MLRLAASVTCMSPLTYRETIPALDAEGLCAYHLDVCDGHFAPTFLLYPGLLPHLRLLTRCRLDVHLYCVTPSRYVDEFADGGADTLIIHWEIQEDPAAVVAKIRARGAAAGLAFLPTTPVPDSLASLLPSLRMVVANSVGPAYAGQRFDPRGLANLRRVRALARAAGRDLEVAADGSVSRERLPAFFAAGSDHLVLGTSSVFAPGQDPALALRDFKRLAEAAFAAEGRP
jgi:ribulose-phosphate 3-epimerase